MARRDQVIVTIASPLEPELVQPLGEISSRLEIRFAPDLLPAPRYPCDHRGEEGFRRDPAGESRWREMLGAAEVLFGIPGEAPAELARVVAASDRLRWVQGTAAGTGEQVRAAALSVRELERVAFTSARGIHATMLAEFALMGLLAFTKDLARLQADQAQRRWEHRPLGELRGKTVLILGMGEIGVETARLTRALGMHPIAVNRRGRSDSPDVDEVHPPEGLHGMLERADALVVTLPLTDQTAGLLNAEALARLPPGAILVNVGRGGVIDERALIDALRQGRLRGAALDVFASEPLPAESPLWGLPNVLLSPHTAALSVHENERLVELFAENLRRYLDGRPLRNRVDTTHFY
ncbi:MAG TPA: D-2-hydroxyacid dehydrogenase [Solirubrobacteraceae bacterium]|nr:D-2-hydroxyacid dehydrogenase [Solirubrobacteraceae bacterium]